MRSRCNRLILAALLLVALGRPGQAGTPDFEVLTGSSVTLGIAGAMRTIVIQSLPLAPAWQAGSALRSEGVMTLPRINLAFGEYVDIFENQGFTVALDASTGQATLDMVLWLLDSDGNGVELPVTLTSGVPGATDCNGVPYCLGQPGDPPYCTGAVWSGSTGQVKLVGTTRIPNGSGTTVDCSVVAIVVKARIAATNGDGDSAVDAVDDCPDLANASQADGDADGHGDVCDNCPVDFNPYQADSDDDGAGDACEPLLINFQPAAAPIPAGYRVDSGLTFSAVRTYGWTVGNPQTRDRNILADQRLDTFAFSTAVATWEAQLPPALYDLTLAIGDPQFAQGPQTVVVEDLTLFDHVTTAAGQNLTTESLDRLPADGRITVDIGGGGGMTALNYLTAVEAAEQPFLARFINFQPSASPVPVGFEMDAGAPYDTVLGRGWSANLQSQTRDRHQLQDPVLDTLLFTTGTFRTWNLVVPADYYEVRISVGDSQFAQGPQTVVVEGETWLSDGQTAIGEFINLLGRVYVLDGALTLGIGEAGGTTAINYVSVVSVTRDLDGDDVSNLVDNCPDVANPGQQDTDADGQGDHCSEDLDGDGTPEVLDNCPGTANPGQADADLDAHGDVCDCAPTNGSAFAEPGEVPIVLMLVSGALTWPDQTAGTGPGTAYDVLSVDLSDLGDDGSFADAGCLTDDEPETTFDDPRTPPGGDGYGYLVRADNVCGAGTYGQSTLGTDPRAALDGSGPCP